MEGNKVDVVLPNYNKVRYIGECLESLKSQTHEKWRCIVIDGYSDDGSWEIIQEAARGDDRFDLFQLDRIGLYKSWNFGLDKVSSPYFAVLTSDDVWEEHWLETAVTELNKHEDAISAAARTRYFDEHSTPGAVTKLNDMGERFFANISDDQKKGKVQSGFASSVATYFVGPIYSSVHSVVTRSTILDHTKFAEDLGSAADVEWVLKMGFFGDIVYCKDVNAFWRHYPEQASARAILDEQSKVREAMERMNQRNKSEIAQRLSTERQNKFLESAREYAETYRPYFYSRPPLAAFRANPFRSVLKMVKAVKNHPLITLRETFNFLFRSRRYINEKRLHLATRVLKG